MRKSIYILVGIFFVGVASILLYRQWDSATLVDRCIKSYTGLQNYEVVTKKLSAYDWFAKIKIIDRDGENVLTRYPFHKGFSKGVLSGKLENPYVSDCPTCWYYLEDRGHGPYGYRLYILAADQRELDIYEQFGN